MSDDLFALITLFRFMALADELIGLNGDYLSDFDLAAYEELDRAGLVLC